MKRSLMNTNNSDKSGSTSRANQQDWRGPVIAASAIMLFFCIGAYLLPSIMIYLGDKTVVGAVIFGVLFVLSFFVVFWWRAWVKRR